MGSNAANGTRQVWVSDAVHLMAKKQAKEDNRTLRKSLEIATAKGLGYETLKQLEEEAKPLIEQRDQAAQQKRARLRAEKLAAKQDVTKKPAPKKKVVRKAPVKPKVAAKAETPTAPMPESVVRST